MAPAVPAISGTPPSLPPPALPPTTIVPGGYIGADTEWTVAGSPYLVQGTLVISEGVTFTVDPGVVVESRRAPASSITARSWRRERRRRPSPSRRR